MTLDPALLADFRAYRHRHAGKDDGPTVLETLPEIVGYCVECARQDGGIDECDAVELALTDISFDRERLRATAATLKRLGYVRVAERLRHMAHKAKGRLRPSQRTASAKAYIAHKRHLSRQGTPRRTSA